MTRRRDVDIVLEIIEQRLFHLHPFSHPFIHPCSVSLVLKRRYNDRVSKYRPEDPRRDAQ
jgi:hypothetical protein